MTVLRDRKPEFEAAGVKTYGISRDSPWSHVAWAQVLDLGDTPLLSDWNGEAIQGFGVEQVYRGMRGVAERSAFLVDGDGDEFDSRVGLRLFPPGDEARELLFARGAPPPAWPLPSHSAPRWPSSPVLAPPARSETSLVPCFSGGSSRPVSAEHVSRPFA